MGKPNHLRRHLHQTACGASKRLEALEAGERIEHVHQLISLRHIRLRLAEHSPHQHPKPFAPALVARPYHLPKVWVERCQTPQPTERQPVRLPEASKHGNVLVQRIARVGAPKRIGKLLHAPTACQRVAERLQQPDLRSELMIDRQARDIGLARHRLHRKHGEAGATRDELAGSLDDAGTGLICGGLATTKLVRTWTHDDLDAPWNTLYCLYIQINWIDHLYNILSAEQKKGRSHGYARATTGQPVEHSAVAWQSRHHYRRQPWDWRCHRT